MDEIVGEMDCRYRADSIMMSLLRSAMDDAHEKVQSRDGPIECLNERSKFYKLAIIQIDGSLKLIKEEPEDRIPETNRKKMLTDLVELEDLLHGRLNDTRNSIIEKDKELIKRLENEFRLRQALDSKEKEVVSLQSKLELERTKSETIQEFLLNQHRANIKEGEEEDFNELKNSIEKQVLSIKQRLEDERMNLTGATSMTRKTSTNMVDLEPEFQSFEIKEYLKGKVDISPNKIMLVGDWSRPEQNAMIEQMSSDIDILKGTLDLTFERMQTAEARPLEKQWRWSIEKQTILITVKEFIHDLMLKSQPFAKFPNCSKLVDEMVELRSELQTALDIRTEVDYRKSRGVSPMSSRADSDDDEVIEDGCLDHLRIANSEPIMDPNDAEDLDAQRQSNHVAKMIKNHESIIRKQQEQLNWFKIREAFRRNAGGSSENRENELDAIEKRVRRVITRLDSFINVIKKWSISSKYPLSGSQNGNPIDDGAEKNAITTRLRDERDELDLQTSAMEENYVILLKGLANDCAYESIETQMSDEVYKFVCVETLNDTILRPFVGVQRTITRFQENVSEKLHTTFSRLEQIKQQIGSLTEPASSNRNEGLVYKKAFARRCENLILAETEVDLLGDQVEALQDLLRKIYVVLDRNSSVLSHNFEVRDVLKLTKKALSS